VPKAPAIVKDEPPPPPAAEGGPSLRPAFDDRPKNLPPAAPVTTTAARETPPPPRVNVVTPVPASPRPAPASKPAVITVPTSSNVVGAAPSGEGGSDMEFALQLGSFKTETLAESGWKSVLKVAGDSLGGLSHAIEPVELPEKGTVFRLFAEALPDREAALALCRTLRDKGTACIVVRR
jgi:hypothetical protein